MLKRICAAACVAAVIVAGMSGGASAAVGSGYVLDLQLNERAGASFARDASGMGHRGTIGSHVVMNGRFALFDRHPHREGDYYDLDHLVVIPDAADASLDPGKSDFRVGFRFRTQYRHQNIVQKGQALDPGGQVKLELAEGRLSCLYRTPYGSATARTGTSRLLNDSRWHSVRCVRSASAVTLYVDGALAARRSRPTGMLDNTAAWTIGGKPDCEADSVGCDYYAGQIDYLRISKR
jgi:hypothetical protein